MSLTQQLDTDLKEAMKARDKDRLKVIRMLKTEIKEAMIKDRVQDLSDVDALKVIISYQKKLNNSAVQFRDGGREDLALEVDTELRYVVEYLPKQLSEEEVVVIISNAIVESGASEPKDMGAVMKMVVPQTTGKFDNKRVSQLVKKILN